MKCEIFDVQNITSTNSAYSMKTCFCDGKLYAFRILNKSTKEQEFLCYDIEKKEWSQKTPCPISGVHSNMINAEGNIYVTFGYPPTTSSATYNLNRLLKYVPSEDKWYYLNNIPYNNVTTSGINSYCYYNGNIYVLGIYNQKYFFKYSIKDDEYISLTKNSSIAEGRYHATMIPYKNKIYVIGGYSGGSDIHIYDMLSDTWTTQTIKYKIGMNQATVFNNMCYIIANVTVGSTGAGINMIGYSLNLDTFEMKVLNNINGMSTFTGLNFDNSNIWMILANKQTSINFYPVCVNFEDFIANVPTEITTNLLSQISNIEKLNKVVVSSFEEPDTKIRHAFSFDNKTTWKIYDGTNWIDIKKEDILDKGMDKDFINLLTSDDFLKVGLTNFTLDICSVLITYNSMFSPKIYKIECCLK